MTTSVTTLLADNFETTFAAWTLVDQEGDATATISSEQSHSGNCAAKISVTTAGDSRAYITKDLGGNKTNVWATGWFYVAAAGPDPSDNAPYLRFFNGSVLDNPTSHRIVDVFRSNTDGSAWLGVPLDGLGGQDFIDLNTVLAIGTWHQVTLHVAPGSVAGTPTSTVQVWIDNNVTPIYTSTTTNLFTTTSLTTVLLGNEHVSQQMTEYFDDVCIGAS
jgi:hypothetical protein